jgi:plastocyanin
MASLRALTALSALTALGVAACGGDDGESGRTVTAAANQPVEVVGTEYAFDPSTVVVEGAEGPLEIELDNDGSLAHNLRIFDGATEVGGTSTFQAGESQIAEVELEPGTYRMVCTVANHEQLGMVGEIEVR